LGFKPGFFSIYELINKERCNGMPDMRYQYCLKGLRVMFDGDDVKKEIDEMIEQGKIRPEEASDMARIAEEVLRIKINGPLAAAVKTAGRQLALH